MSTPTPSPGRPQAGSGLGPRRTCRELAAEKLLLPGVRVFDPQSELDRDADLLLADGRIAAFDPSASERQGAEVLSELEGCHVFCGFIDPHVHLRTPGFEYKEDVESGSRAAAAGGFTTVVAMANTDPVVDSGPVAGWVLDQAEQTAWVRVGQVGAVTRGQRGEELAELRELLDAGVTGFSDDGHPVKDTDLLLHALRYLRDCDRPLLLHLEDSSAALDGVMHEGAWSARLGLRGVPVVAETGPLGQALDGVAYASAEAERLGKRPTPVHLQHLSAGASLARLRLAKDAGLPVTAEVTPHHLLLVDAEVRTFDQNLKVNPPVRSEADRLELIRGLAEGWVDCVGTDHAPHAPHEKEVPFEQAAFGTVGLESAFAALYAGLVVSGELALENLITAMTVGPARCLRLPSPRLEVGSVADLTVVDLAEEWTLSEADLAGKSRNSAFLGRRMQGRVKETIVAGSRRLSAYRLRGAPSANGARD